MRVRLYYWPEGGIWFEVEGEEYDGWTTLRAINHRVTFWLTDNLYGDLDFMGYL